MKNHLFKYKWVYLLLTFVVIGFVKVNTSGPLDYINLIEKPNVKINGDYIEVFLGYAESPIWWINPKVKIENTKIYISAKWSNWRHPNTIFIKLPDTKKVYQVFWLDQDGKITQI